jgi:hypothetical protein
MSEPTTITLPPALAATEWDTYDHMNGGDGGIHPVEKCLRCGKGVSDGDPMRKLGDEWMHDACAVEAITTADIDAAWLLLADMITARPSAFRASDIKAALSNVARIARRGAA